MTRPHTDEGMRTEAQLLRTAETTDLVEEVWTQIWAVLRTVKDEAREDLTKGQDPMTSFAQLIFIGIRLAEATDPIWRKTMLEPDDLTLDNDGAEVLAQTIRVGAATASRLHNAAHHFDGPEQ